MDPNTIYARFADGCDRRRERIITLLNDARAGTAGGGGLAQRVNLLVHDWIGEANLLGFSQVAAVANKLSELLGTWADKLDPTTQGAQIASWVARLASASKELALSAPSEELQARVRAIDAEVTQELEGIAPDTSTTGEFASVDMGRRILILDDSPIVGEVLALELEGRGHKVELATNLEQFNAQLVGFGPELIFLDINMPEMRGDDVCRELRSRTATQHVPIIFLSSLPDDELKALAARADANGYLSKQRGMDELVKYLDEVLSEIIF